MVRADLEGALELFPGLVFLAQTELTEAGHVMGVGLPGPPRFLFAKRGEEVMARSLLSRRVLARVLERKIASGDFTRSFALEVARAMLHDNAARAFARK